MCSRLSDFISGRTMQVAHLLSQGLFLLSPLLLLESSVTYFRFASVAILA